MTEKGIKYDVYAVQGQVMLFFNDNVSEERAINIIRLGGADIIKYIPYLNYYLVEVASGKEGEFIDLIQSSYQLRMGNNCEVDFVYPNSIEQLCSAQTFVLDNFNSDHGQMVEQMASGCDEQHAIETYNVSAGDSEKSISTNGALETANTILTNLSTNENAVINLSFGTYLTKFWSIITPWQKRVLWNDRFVTDDNKAHYIRRYINHLKPWIKLATKYDNKDFVFVKAVGNEGMKRMETIIDELKNELSPSELAAFERHFILVSAKDDYKEGDYPNDVSSYNDMLTKVDISDKTSQSLHWQGTSFASPRVAGYITCASNEYGMKVVDVLTAVRAATQNATNYILTYDALIDEIDYANTINRTFYEIISNDYYENAFEDSIVAQDTYNNSVVNIEKDLVGQTIYEPSDNGYFPQSWRWKIERGEVLGVEVIYVDEDIDEARYSILAHLHRDEMRVDAEMLLYYKKMGHEYSLQSSSVTNIVIPRQTDYSQYVTLKMDYDFFPSLVLYNNCDITLFVGGEYSDREETKYFGAVVEPYSNVTIAMGAIQSFNIHFAHRK